jgi:microcystin-dependent protein
MTLPALPPTADSRAITERLNVLIRDYNQALRLPTGVVVPFAGASAPDGYLLCYGQAVSRSSYSDLFAAIGTTWGAGDGSTTFNVPDLRGRVAAGKDDMGGTAANRITNAVSGIVGTTLGAAGGDQNMPAHVHGMLTRTDVTNGGAAGAFASSVSNLGQTTQTAGTGASANVQPTIILNHIIST